MTVELLTRNNVLDGFKDVMNRYNLATNGNFSINQRSLFTTMTACEADDYLCDGWFIEDLDIDVLKCVHEDGHLHFEGEGKVDQEIVLTSVDSAGLSVSANEYGRRYAITASVGAYSTYPIQFECLPRRASGDTSEVYQAEIITSPSKPYVEAIGSLKSRLHEPAYAGTITITLKFNGSFDFKLYNFREILGAFRYLPESASVHPIEDLNRSKRYYQNGTLEEKVYTITDVAESDQNEVATITGSIYTPVDVATISSTAGVRYHCMASTSLVVVDRFLIFTDSGTVTLVATGTTSLDIATTGTYAVWAYQSGSDTVYYSCYVNDSGIPTYAHSNILTGKTLASISISGFAMWVVTEDGYIYLYELNGVGIITEKTYYDAPGVSAFVDVWADGIYGFSMTESQIFVLAMHPDMTFSQTAEYEIASYIGTATAICGNSDYIFVSGTNGIITLRRKTNGDLSYVCTSSVAANATKLTYDGKYLYAKVSADPYGYILGLNEDGRVIVIDTYWSTQAMWVDDNKHYAIEQGTYLTIHEMVVTQSIDVTIEFETEFDSPPSVTATLDALETFHEPSLVPTNETEDVTDWTITANDTTTTHATFRLTKLTTSQPLKRFCKPTISWTAEVS